MGSSDRLKYHRRLSKYSKFSKIARERHRARVCDATLPCRRDDPTNPRRWTRAARAARRGPATARVVVVVVVVARCASFFIAYGGVLPEIRLSIAFRTFRV